MSQIDAILFDKDGTLFDFQATWSKWFLEVIAELAGEDHKLFSSVAEQLGFDAKSKRFLEGSSFIAGTPEVALRAFLYCFPDKSVSEIADVLSTSTLQAKQVPSVPLQPLLQDLKQRGLKIGLVTNDREDAAVSHLTSAGCRNYFDFVGGSDSGYGAKPHPGMLLAACSEFGIMPENCIMVGDSPTDMETARRAGMKSIAVLTGVDRAETLSSCAEVVLDDIGRIPDFLDDRL